MAISNAELAQQISDLVNRWDLREEEMIDWLAGVVGGGVGLDGKYPITDALGVTTNVTCPAQLEDDVEGLVASASTYATDAAASAAAAAVSETNAGTSETNAAASASAAATSATQAETASTSAQNSASNALASETSAAASEAAAAASYDSFDDRYLGAYASDPTLDNDGEALLTGALYWNTTSSVLRAYTGSAWVTAVTPDASYAALADDETITGAWDFANVLRATDRSIPASGVGLEISYDTAAGKAVLSSYDRDGSVRKDLALFGANIAITPDSGSLALVGTGTGNPNISAVIFQDSAASNVAFVGQSAGSQDFKLVNYLNSDLLMSVQIGEEVKVSVNNGSDYYDVKARNRGCLAYKNTPHSLTDATWTPMTFDTETYDTSSIHNNTTNPTRFTVPAGVTKVQVRAQARVASNAIGNRALRITKNGISTFAGRGITIVSAVSGTETALQCSTPIVEVTAGDYFEIEAYQNSGGALNLQGGNDSYWAELEIVEAST